MLRKSWVGLGGWGGDDDLSITSTHVTCYAHDVSCTFTHVTCYASHGKGWVGGWVASLTASVVVVQCTLTATKLGNQSPKVGL